MGLKSGREFEIGIIIRMTSNIMNESKQFLDHEEKLLNKVSSLKKKYNELEKSICSIKECKAPKKTKKSILYESKLKEIDNSLLSIDQYYEEQLAYCKKYRDDGISQAQQEFDKKRAYYDSLYENMIKNRNSEYENKKNRLNNKKEVIDTEFTTINLDKSIQEISFEKEITNVKNEIKSIINILEIERKKVSNKVIAYLIETDQYRDYIKHYKLQNI
jgi:hypothetical protein